MDNRADNEFDEDEDLSLPVVSSEVRTEEKKSKVVDLTLEVDKSDSEEEVQVEAVVLPPPQSYRVEPPKRQLPDWNSEAEKRRRLEHIAMYGQEFSFTIATKDMVEAKWTGVAQPAQRVIDLVNSFLKYYLPTKQRAKAFWILPADSAGRHRLGMMLQVYRAFEQQLRRQCVTTVPIPDQVLTLFSMGRGGDASVTEVDDSITEWLQGKLPPKLFTSLGDFQKVGVHWGAKTKGGRCLIADEPGLGKTIQAIGVAWCFEEEWPLLVVAPSSARFHWQAEIVKWLTDEDGTVHVSEEEVQVLTGGNQPLKRGVKALVVSYDLVDRVSDLLDRVNEGRGFQVVIADECHMLKNANTKRAKAMLPRLKRASRAILLSGTPALSRPRELWSQLNVIDPRQWPAFNEFTKRYCSGEAEGGQKGASNTYELHLLLRENCMIRRLKADILKSLPPKSRRRVVVDLEDGPLKAQLYDDLCDFLTRSGQAASLAKKKSRLMEIALERLKARGAEKATAESAAAGRGQDPTLSNKELADQRKSLLMQLFKNTGTAKLPGIRKHIEGILSSPTAPKFLVFAHHHSVLDDLEKTVFAGVKIIRIDGRTNPKERQASIIQFQTDPTIRAALLGITAAGVAITLTAASRAVFTELFWTPAALLQAEDRCHRIGQTAPVQIDYMLAENCVDDILWPLIEEKVKVLGEIVEGVKETSMAFESEELHEVGGDLFDELGREDVDRVAFGDDIDYELDEGSEGDEGSSSGNQPNSSASASTTSRGAGRGHSAVASAVAHPGRRPKPESWKPSHPSSSFGGAVPFSRAAFGDPEVECVHVQPGQHPYQVPTGGSDGGTAGPSSHGGHASAPSAARSNTPPNALNMGQLQMERLRASLGLGPAPPPAALVPLVPLGPLGLAAQLDPKEEERQKLLKQQQQQLMLLRQQQQQQLMQQQQEEEEEASVSKAGDQEDSTLSLFDDLLKATGNESLYLEGPLECSLEGSLECPSDVEV